VSQIFCFVLNCIVYRDNSITTITSITRTSQTFLESPYESRCSYYEKDMPYNSNSFEDCLRKCFIESCYQLNQCFFWNYKNIITESDFKHNNYSVFCNEIQINSCNREVNQNICQKLCPIDCIKDEYEIMSTFRIKEYRYDTNITAFMKWDSEEPLITYKETPNMLLIDYFTYIGGLFGLWFGVSLKFFF